MSPIQLIQKYYPEGSELYAILLNHSQSVANKALALARQHPERKMDLKFIEEAALLHDIGIRWTDAPGIQCFGEQPYICHGYLGYRLLLQEGWGRHALVCERHVGAGISRREIIDNGFPLPRHHMLPVSPEEKVICYADKFFSKTALGQEKTREQIAQSMARYGDEALQRWLELDKLFAS